MILHCGCQYKVTAIFAGWCCAVNKKCRRERQGRFSDFRTFLILPFIMSLGMSYKPNIHQHVPGTSVNPATTTHPQSPNIATLQSYRPIVNDFGPPSLGFPQSTSGTQVPQNKYAELLAIIEELGKEIRPTYAGSKTAMERLKRGIIHARGLVRECLAETERNARS